MSDDNKQIEQVGDDATLKEEHDEEEFPLPKWEWLLISAAAFRAFFPILILVVALITLAGYLLWSVAFGM